MVAGNIPIIFDLDLKDNKLFCCIYIDHATLMKQIQNKPRPSVIIDKVMIYKLPQLRTEFDEVYVYTYCIKKM